MYSPTISSILNFLSGYTNFQQTALFASFIIYGIAVLIFLSVFDYAYGWAERKVMAKAQGRHGPNTVGRYGILQNLADIVKLLSKESILPEGANKYLLYISVPSMLALLVFLEFLLPLTPSVYGIDISVGMLLVFTLLSFTPILVFVAGWASGNRFASIGSQRSVMMLIAYEIPMLLVMAGVALAARSFDFISIVSAQSQLPFIILMPIGFVIFFIVMLAELERPPFDIREADSELIAGWLTDISAPFYAQALFIDYTRVLVGSSLITLLFLGGWNGPSILPPIAWFLAKILAVALTFIIIRISTVRMRIDRLVHIGFVYLLPLAVLNIILVFFLFYVSPLVI
jgi:NADH-quinone oxidoreductase subunit H